MCNKIPISKDMLRHLFMFLDHCGFDETHGDFIKYFTADELDNFIETKEKLKEG